MRALVTGGAGFIGSSIVEALAADGADVVVLDDLSTGFGENVSPAATLVEGDVADEAAVRRAAEGCELVFHLAASRAVSRSVEQPLETDRVNVAGTLTVLLAARDAGARRVITASSSSVYGGADQLPTPETAPLVPRSPYAVSKMAGEHYARVFFELYGVETVALRYFNVYGPRQRPDSQYAAVIPLFVDALRQGRAPEIHGDGLQSRDFTYITDVVAANLLAASAPAERCAGKVFNIAGGRPHTLLDLLGVLREILGTDVEPVHVGPRPGDIRHSYADASRATEVLGHRCEVDLPTGLARTVEWFTARQAA